MNFFQLQLNLKEIESLFEMEGTYAIESYPYVSKKLNCWSYFLEYTNLLKETLYSNQDVLERLITDEEKVASQLGIDIDEYHHFEELCG